MLRVDQRGFICLGPSLVSLGRVAATDLTGILRPVLQALAERTSETGPVAAISIPVPADRPTVVEPQLRDVLLATATDCGASRRTQVGRSVPGMSGQARGKCLSWPNFDAPVAL